MFAEHSVGARAVLGAFCIFAHLLLTATLEGKTGLIVEVDMETQKGQLPCLGLVYSSINGNILSYPFTIIAQL